MFVLLAVSTVTITALLNSPEKYAEVKQKERSPHRIAEVTVTCYNAVASQCDATPLQTAGMYTINPKRASEQKFVAVSRDLLKKNGGRLQLGDKVRIRGTGAKDSIYTVADVMNKRYRNHVDILETEGKPIYKFENAVLLFADKQG